MQDTRQMLFEAQKQAVIDQNEANASILVPMTSEAVSLIAHDIETAEAMAELLER